MHLILGCHDKESTLRLPWVWVKDVCFLKHINQEGIWLSHYSHRSWKKSFHGSWHLFGHSHGKRAPYCQSFDVGVDCWNFTPVELEEVRAKMETLDRNEE
jgi:calcineurin-like phosphoesterase family protein